MTICILSLVWINGKGDEIHDAVQKGDLSYVIQLLDNNPGMVNLRDSQGMTPLHHAIESEKNEISTLLLEYGADPSLRDRRSDATALHYAAAKGNLDIGRSILDNHALILEYKDIQQKTALHIACENGKAAMVKLLLDHGADIRARDHLGLTPLMSSCSGWNMEVVYILVGAGAKINDITIYQDREYNTLVIASMYRFRELIDYLIALKADLPESVLDLALRNAVQGNHQGLFEYVQCKGLKINDEAMEKFPDLIYVAAGAGAFEIFMSLIQSGYDPYLKDRYGWTAFHHAASRGKMEMLKFLKDDVRLEVNARSVRGETALNVASFLGLTETVEYLTAQGADTSVACFPEICGIYMGQDIRGRRPEMFMPGIVSGPYRAHGTVVFSPAGDEAWWSDMIPGSQCAMEMKMVNGQWTAPKRSIMWKDPSISPDGKRLVYISKDPIHKNIAGNKENYWYMDRYEDGWTDPKPLDTVINNLNIHWQCSMDLSGNLYFSEFEDNMYVSLLKNGKYQRPVNLKTYYQNATLNGHSPAISASGDYLVFADKERLYVSFRKRDGTWTDRIDLGEDVNSGAANGSPWISADGKYLFFQSTTGKERPWGIYWVSAEIIHELKEEIYGIISLK